MNQVATDTQHEETKEQERQELLKVKPDLAGFRNGIFIEPDPIDFADHPGYTSLFDGNTLAGWDGHPDVWSVKDGAIVGETTTDRYPHTFPNTFLVCRGTEAKDFDLKLEIKVEKGGGSGIQYRSSTGNPASNAVEQQNGLRAPRWTMIGPQADFWYPVDATAKSYTGQLYSQNDSRGIIAWRGQVVQSLAGKMPQLVGTIADRARLGASVKDGGWNQYMIIARGAVILHILNGQLMAALIDDDPASSNNVPGLFGLQVEGVPCKVSFRNLWLKKIS
jgi:Domain of Unknown Function (DUF1080)